MISNGKIERLVERHRERLEEKDQQLHALKGQKAASDYGQ